MHKQLHITATVTIAYTCLLSCYYSYKWTLCSFIENPYPVSAGVGRTGTFITIDAMMERLKERDDLNIFEFVNEMRTRRKQMVQIMVSIMY